MLKISNKRSTIQANGTSCFVDRNGLVQYSKRFVQTKRLLQGANNVVLARQRVFDIQATLRSGVGIVRLNREHRFNTLTPSFAQQVSRGVESMYLDHTVKVIYLAPAEGQHFSNGTDFRTIMHYKASKENQKLAKYLEDIFQLQATFAKTNKLILSVAPGHSFNSGAGLLAASGFPAICDSTKIAFNECTFGFVPHAGSTYYAKELPGDFGTFLALTGLPLTGKEAVALGLADSLIEVPETYENEVTDIVNALHPPTMPDSETVLGAQGKAAAYARQFPGEQAAARRARAVYRQNMNDAGEFRLRTGQRQLDERFVDPRARKPDVVAQADLEYKTLLKTHHLSTHGQAGPGYFDAPAETFNSFAYVHQHLSLHVGEVYDKETVKSILQHREMIDRCFWPDSIEEIMANLKCETHPFAKTILAKMESNSMLSMKLALRMLRKARNLCYGEILKMELNVALNKVADSDFDLGVQAILMKPTRVSRFNALRNPGFKKRVSEQELDSYFSENSLAKEIDLKIVENALLPTRHFFQKFSDSVRIWINETSTPQVAEREAVELEIQDALRAQGIDLRNKTVTVPMARSYLTKKVRIEKKEAEEVRRALQLIQDPKLRSKYFEQINLELEKYVNNQVFFYNAVNQKVRSVFEEAYLSRLSTIFEKSKEAQSLEKRRMFIRFKKFLIKSRILAYVSVETDKLLKQIEALPFQQMHLTEKWDESFRDKSHPELQQSIMWHLSKAVGKASLAPPELIKTYQTNPEAAKALQVYVFDKKELLRLRKDILENPSKYEEMLTKEAEHDEFYDESDKGEGIARLKAKKYRREFWFRLINDGRLKSSEDSWPMRVEYHNYKRWADSIKYKALDSLKFTVSRLLNDFSHDEKAGNSVAHFENKPDETKRQSLARLLSKLNQDQKDPFQERISKTKKGSHHNRALRRDSRPLTDIKKYFNNLIESDKELSRVFGQVRDSQKNSFIDKFRQEILGQLVQLVETVLLEQSHKNIGNTSATKIQLQERLAKLMAPSNIAQDCSMPLGLLDECITDKIGQDAIRAAINKVKPFFFAVLEEKLEEEASRVLNSFGCSENSASTLTYYLFGLRNQKSLTEGVAAKITGFHTERVRDEFREKSLPTTSRSFLLRQMLSSLGTGIDDQNETSLAKRLQKLEVNTRNQVREARLAEKWQDAKGEMIEQNLQQKREDLLKVPFDAQQVDPNDEELLATLTQRDHDELEQLTDKVSEIERYLQEHQYEVATLLTKEDWLGIYHKSVKELQLDVDHLHRTNADPQQYMNDLAEHKLPIDKLRQEFQGADQSINWESLADYAGYLKGLYQERAAIFAQKDAQDNFDRVVEFMTSHDRISVDRESESSYISRESLFQSIVSASKNEQNFQYNQQQNIRKQIESFEDLITRFEENSQIFSECWQLAKVAPQQIKNSVETMLSSESKYVDYKELRAYLARKDFGRQVDPKQFINKEKLLRDVQQGQALPDFMRNYKDVRVDVVSLVELKNLLEVAKPTQIENSQLLAQVNTLIEHVDQQLAYVSNERRQQISLGEFLQRHHYLKSTSFREYSSELLRSQIENTLGRGGENFSDFFEHQLDGVNALPQVDFLTDQKQSEFQDQINIAAKKDADLGKEYIKPIQGDSQKRQNEENTKQEAVQKAVYLDAMKLTSLGPEMKAFRNLYENSLLKEYMKADYDQTKVENLIQEYTQARLKACALNVDFAKATKSQNGHIYLKTLREAIMEELNLNGQAKLEEFQWMPLEFTEELPLQLEPEAKYNLNHLNNENAIGYNKLEERAANLEANNDIAHESVFDKLMADYFLEKRGEYKQSNKLLRDLEKLFDQKPSSTFNQTPGSGNQTLGYQYLRQSVGKDDNPELLPYNFPALMELDIAVNRQLHKDTSGLSKELRAIEENEEVIPKYFDFQDVRKPAHLYVSDKLHEVIDQLFEARNKVEKYLTRRELEAYDQELAQHLKHESLANKLKREIYKDYNELQQLNQMSSHMKDNERNEEKQLKKQRNLQPTFNKDVLNEDAFYKHLAYSATLEQQRKAMGAKEVLRDLPIAAGVETFESYYQDELFQDAKRPARPINPETFLPKKRKLWRTTTDKQEAGYLDMQQRGDRFLEAHREYKEDKLTMVERQETQFILEQFFEASKQNKLGKVSADDSLQEAQKHLRNFFERAENQEFK